MVPYSESVVTGADENNGQRERDLSFAGTLLIWAIAIAAIIGCSDITAWLN